MNEKQTNEGNDAVNNAPYQTVIGKDKKRIPLKRSALLSLVILVVAVVLVVTSVVVIKKRNDAKEKKAAQTLKNLPAPKKVDISETNTPTAYGNFLAIALESYWIGGNTNGVSIPGHKYYPSQSDIKDLNWAKQNLQIDESLHQLISSGNIIYKPSGCDINKASSPSNKCTGFTVLINDKEIAKNKN